MPWLAPSARSAIDHDVDDLTDRGRLACNVRQPPIGLAKENAEGLYLNLDAGIVDVV